MEGYWSLSQQSHPLIAGLELYHKIPTPHLIRIILNGRKITPHCTENTPPTNMLPLTSCCVSCISSCASILVYSESRLPDDADIGTMYVMGKWAQTLAGTLTSSLSALNVTTPKRVIWVPERFLFFRIFPGFNHTPQIRL